jgi:hypothetical protein
MATLFPNLAEALAGPPELADVDFDPPRADDLAQSADLG